jgi:hypothetical protein
MTVQYIHQKQNDEKIFTNIYKYCCHGIAIIIDEKTMLVLDENQLQQLTKQLINYQRSK